MIGNENQWVPQNLHDKPLEEEFAALWARLRQKSPYPERRRDLVRLEELKARADREMKDRRAAVARPRPSWRGWIRTTRTTTPRRPRGGRCARRSRRRSSPPAASPTRTSTASTTRRRRDSTARLAPPKDKRPFDARFKAARARRRRRSCPPTSRNRCGTTAAARRLFAEYEERLVKETIDAPRRKRAAEQTKRDKMQAAYQQQLRHEQAIQQIQIAPFQAPAVAAFGEVAAAGYLLYSGADTLVQFNRAMKSGSPTDAVGAVLPLATGMVVHQTIRTYGGGYGRGGGGGRGLPGEALPPSAATRAAAQEVGPDVVRAAYRANLNAVKQSGGDDWHQFQWERAGEPARRRSPSWRTG